MTAKSVKLVAPAPRVPAVVQVAPPLGLRSMTKPVSLIESSCQVTVAVASVDVAAAPVGAPMCALETITFPLSVYCPTSPWFPCPATTTKYWPPVT
ncbi:MAG: hypothetical protein ACREIT_02675 [Tepidisphaeraceae bacterium]